MSTNPYKKRIAELITRYKFEPTLHDIYVEGERDRLFLTAFFAHFKARDVGVYPISVVDVPSSMVKQLCIAGNRGRVVALCLAIDAEISPDLANVLGLIDKDFDELFHDVPNSRLILLTDFSCLECYSLYDHSFNKFCLIYLGKYIEPDKLARMSEILVEVYLLRAAKRALAEEAPWIPDFTRCCKMVDGNVCFDREGFIDRLLNVWAGRVNRELLDVKVLELQTRLQGDCRSGINGHDLVRLLSWVAHHMGVAQDIYREAALGRGLLTSVEFAELEGAPLFRRLLAWARA
jgi:hypothetical protein